MALKDEILECFKSKSGDCDLPGEGFIFSGDKNALTMTFATRKSGEIAYQENMQEDNDAFEGWATAIYAHYMKGNGTITLDVAADAPPFDEARNKQKYHQNRFLYRALRFSRQYPWFRLSPRLKKETDFFATCLADQKKVVNNRPAKEADNTVKEKDKPENKVEKMFAGNYSDYLWRLLEEQCQIPRGQGFFRQLPMGLFAEEAGRDNRIFPGGSAAIDLWAISGDTLVIMELKAKNKMVGILTEAFFYANYVSDMFVNPAPVWQPTSKTKGKDYRGYMTLCNAAPSLKKVLGVLLVDKDSDHPLIDDNVLNVLNAGMGNAKITYKKAVYDPQKLK